MITPWDTLTRFCRGSGDAVIAAPYMKEDALSRLLEALAPGAALVCVTRWKLDDLLFGASDVNCRTLVLQWGGSFLLHPRLHAKFYRFGSQVLVGSANLTPAGMGCGSPANLEILCTPEAGFDADVFERELILGSRPVSDSEFEDWSALAQLPRPDFASTGPAEPLTEWRPGDTQPRACLVGLQTIARTHPFVGRAAPCGSGSRPFGASTGTGATRIRHLDTRRAAFLQRGRGRTRRGGYGRE